MDRVLNVDLTARDYLANTHVELGEVEGVVTAEIWCCLVCGCQGRRVVHRDETPSHTPESLGLGSCARNSHQVALVHWGITNQAQTSLSVHVWNGGGVRGQVSSEGRGYDGLEEISYILAGLAEAFKASSQTLIAMVPQLGFQRDDKD